MSARVALFDELVSAGLKVDPLDGWETRGGKWSHKRPIGIMDHHTAPPVPFPPARLIGTQLKANMSTDPDGTIHLLAYGACNYSSGMGSRVVYAELLDGIVPWENARERGLVDDFNGNPVYWNYENSHAGDGGPLPSAQREAIILSHVVVLDHFGLDVDVPPVIGHCEHTRRKIDPYWDGSRRAIVEIRNETREAAMATYRGVRNVPDKNGVPRPWATDVIDDGIAVGAINVTDDHPEDWAAATDYGTLWTILDRLGWPKGSTQ